MQEINEFPSELIDHFFQFNNINSQVLFEKSKERLEIIRALVRIDKGAQLTLNKFTANQSVNILIELIKVPKFQEGLKEKIIKEADSLSFGQKAIAAAIYPDVLLFSETIGQRNRTFESFNEIFYTIK